MRSVRLYDLGIMPYTEALVWQQRIADEVRAGAPEALALLQHPPVYTRGRLSRPEHLLVGIDTLRQRGAELVDTDRGGDITFHGPGQLVAYPILDLHCRGLPAVDYVRLLEEVIIRALDAFGLPAGRHLRRPGVWIEDAKIAAIGVRVRGGVTTHGFALNVDNDLSWFEAIVPCGLAGARVTTIARELACSVAMQDVQRAIATEFSAAFESSLLPTR